MVYINYTLEVFNFLVAAQGEVDRSSPPADAYLVIYSVIDKASFQRAEDELGRLQDYDLLRARPAILVANKVDLVRSRAVSAQGEEYSLLMCSKRINVLTKIIKREYVLDMIYFTYDSSYTIF